MENEARDPEEIEDEYEAPEIIDERNVVEDQHNERSDQYQNREQLIKSSFRPKRSKNNPL